jgi:hypothetical protein
LVEPALVVVTTVKVPVGVAERCTSNPSSLDDLSCQVSWIDVVHAVVAVRFVGAPNPLAPFASCASGLSG